MLYRAIRDGNEDQRVAAIYWTGLSGDPNAILPIYQAFFASQGEVRETAFNALWNLAAAGTPLPPPAQYGLV
jgi:HEAT repeat protein